MQCHNNTGSNGNRVNNIDCDNIDEWPSSREMADQRGQHMKTCSVVCYQLVEGLSQNLSPLLLNLLHKQVDYTHHLQALQRRIFPACALATVVNEKSGHCQRCCAKKCPFVDSTPVSAIWPQTSTLSSGGIEIGPRHAESCGVHPGGTGLISWKGKGRGKSWNTGDDSHLPSQIIFRDRGNVPRCSLHSHTLSTEEQQVFSAPLQKALLSHICCQEKPGCWRYGKTNTQTHTPSWPVLSLCAMS